MANGANIPIVGELLTRKDISERFGCSPQGGMAKSNKTNTLCLFWDENGVYPDEWDGDLFLYTGQGLSGDQKLTANNKILLESKKNGISVHLFKTLKNHQHEYYGEVELVGSPRPTKYSGRVVFLFPLKLLEMDIKSEGEYEIETKSEMRVVRSLSDDDLYEKAKLSKPIILIKTSPKTTIGRRMDVSEYTKRRAAGKCELCSNKGPFYYKGEWYLETHHIQHLADGGPDIIENTAALCPNCHRKIHYIKNENDIDHLKGLRR